MPGTTSIGGLASGLDTQNIVKQLVELERAPITRLQSRKAKLNAQLTAWQEVNTRILALKDKLSVLSLGINFDGKTFESGDESLLKGTVSAGADAGTYYVRVSKVARSHQVRSDGDGYADTTSARIGTGTISISSGAGSPTVITLDDSNNTLAGLRDAINRSGSGVKAAIVHDGGADTPYHLVLTSSASGSAGQITVATDGTVPTFNTVVQAAQDAEVTMGEGPGAITVTSSTNKITGLIPGATLDVQAADANKVVTVTIGQDTEAVKKSIKEFVDQYNNLVEYIDKQFKYDAASKSSGVLFSDSGLRSIQSELNTRLFGGVSGLSQQITLLSQIGITTSVGGSKLTVDEAELDRALENNLQQVRSMFATVGTPTSPFVSFVGTTDKTKATGQAWAVEITAAATQARLTAGVAQDGLLGADEQLTINGQAIALTAGMSQEDVVARINEFSIKTGVVASRTGAGGQGTGNYLTLTRTAYGSSGAISMKSTVSNGGAGTSGIGTVEATLVSPTGEAGTGSGAAGTDVAGTINGEAATGTGQTLVGNSGNAATDGLRLRISAQTPGSCGTISITKGLATTVAEYLDFVTWTGKGTVQTSQESLRTLMEDIDDDIESLEARVETRRERLVIQFARMESALAELQSQSSRISSQIASWG